jgi:hypothetical protein
LVKSKIFNPSKPSANKRYFKSSEKQKDTALNVSIENIDWISLISFISNISKPYIPFAINKYYFSSKYKSEKIWSFKSYSAILIHYTISLKS